MTFAEAHSERERIQRLYVGVTARVVKASGAYALEIHDIRRSERKTAGQIAVFAVGQLSAGDFVAWSDPLVNLATTQGIYP